MYVCARMCVCVLVGMYDSILWLDRRMAINMYSTSRRAHFARPLLLPLPSHSYIPAHMHALTGMFTDLPNFWYYVMLYFLTKCMHSLNWLETCYLCLELSTVLHGKRVDFEIFYILGHNFLLQRFWVSKLDTHTLLPISYLHLQWNVTNHKRSDFMASQRVVIRKLL